MHRFGIWAPKVKEMTLQWRDQKLPMEGPNKSMHAVAMTMRI
jgi:hypothetical protein